MGFPARYFNGHAASGNLDSVAAGTTVGGTAVRTNNVEVGSLSCLFTVDAETNTLTIAGKWQVSEDNSTWYDAPVENNAANVVLATGTAGADAAVSKAVPAPASIYGWKYVRAAVESGGTTGASGDTYSMTLYYRKANGFVK